MTPELGDDTAAAIGRVMVQLMGDISEDWWCAGWFSDIEFAIWSKRPDYMEDQRCRDLHELSALVGLWPAWDGSDARAVPATEFAERYAAYVAEHGAPRPPDWWTSAHAAAPETPGEDER